MLTLSGRFCTRLPVPNEIPTTISCKPDNPNNSNRDNLSNPSDLYSPINSHGTDPNFPTDSDQLIPQNSASLIIILVSAKYGPSIYKF